MHHPTDRIIHTTAFVTPVMEHWLLFNDAHNTFYLWLYGIRHMIKDQKGSERKPAAAATTWATLD